jgi:hypothetical protein
VPRKKLTFLYVIDGWEICLDLHPDLGLDSGPDRMLHPFHFGQIALGVAPGQNHMRHMRFVPDQDLHQGALHVLRGAAKAHPEGGRGFSLPRAAWAMIRPFSLCGDQDHPS